MRQVFGSMRPCRHQVGETCRGPRPQQQLTLITGTMRRRATLL